MSTAAGACQCGLVRFQVTLPSKWAAHCHCRMCQRAHGAAFVTWFGVDSGAALIDDPQRVLRWYPSSTGAERGFCSRCGSPLFFRSARWPDELHIARAQIEGEIDRLPEAHVYWDSHVGWAQPDLGDGLPRKVEV